MRGVIIVIAISISASLIAFSASTSAVAQNDYCYNYCKQKWAGQAVERCRLACEKNAREKK